MNRPTRFAICNLLLASCFLLLASCYLLPASCFLLSASCFLLPTSCFLLPATCYLLTLPPPLTWAHYGADGGDLATAIALGRLPHPPGFPTYLLLGRLFLHLPWGDPAGRLNLLSALSAATATALLAACTTHHAPRTTHHATRSTQSAIRNLQSAILNLQSAICLSLAPLFWSQALITEVYAPAALFSSAVLFLALRRAPAWLLGIVWGLGLGVHPTLLFLAPVVFAEGKTTKGAKELAMNTKDVIRNTQHVFRNSYSVSFVSFVVRNESIVVVVALLVAGLLYGPILLAHRAVPSPWADLDSLADWWAYVSGQMYHHYLFALPAAFWPRRLLAYLGLLARQFTPVGALLSLWGWARLWRERRSLALFTALTFGLFSLYAIGYNTVDSLVYLVPALPVAALWLAVGMRETAEWLERRRRWAGLLLFLIPVAQAVWGWGAMDLSGDDSAVRWARETLRAAPPNAMLVTSQDAATFTLWYVRDVLGERPDVLILDQDLWGHEPYRRMIACEMRVSPEQLSWPADRPTRKVLAPVEKSP